MSSIGTPQTQDAGQEPSDVLNTGPEVVYPEALLIDPSIHDVPTDDQGVYLGTHPVDHQVQLILLSVQDSIPVANDLGTTLTSLEIDSDDVMSMAARRIVDRDLAELIAAGDILIDSVTASAAYLGRVRVDVSYQNLRLPLSLRKRPVLKIGG